MGNVVATKQILLIGDGACNMAWRTIDNANAGQ